MQFRELNLPASVIRRVNGKQYMLDGTLLSINESANTCKMMIKDHVRTVSIEDVYLSEGVLDTLKSYGKKAWDKIKGVVALVKGFVVPVSEDGQKLFQFFNIPVNVVGMKLSSAIKMSPSESTLETAESTGMNIINDYTADECFADANIREADEANVYWARVMKAYAKNEKFTASDAIKFVNENFYHESKESKQLNEALDSLSSKGALYGAEMGSKELKGFLKRNIISQLKGRTGATCPVVWGAPGIGKSAIVAGLAKDLKRQGVYDLNLITIQCGAVHNDDFVLPATGKNIAGLDVAQDVAKTWLPCYSASLKRLPHDQWERIDNLYNSGNFAIISSALQNIDDNTVNPNFLSTKVDAATGKTYTTGGILFFDEIARMADKGVQSVVMNLVADRKYGLDMVLASRWALIAAANRRSDDGLSELDDIDDGIRAMRMPAVKTRYTHVTYVPSVEDWLSWARAPRSASDNRQNVSEMFCEFVERMGMKAIYDCVGVGGHAATQDELNKLSQVTSGEAAATSSTTRSKDDFMGELIADLEEYQTEHDVYRKAKMTSFNPRTLERQVANVVEDALEYLLAGVDNGFEDCYGDVTHVDSNGEKYVTKSLKASAIAKQLNKVDKDTWFDWCEEVSFDHTDGGKEHWFGWQADAKQDRYAFFMQWIALNVFPVAAGAGSVQAELWKKWNEYGKTMTRSNILSIWRNGEIASEDTEIGKLDNVYCPKTTAASANYMQYPEIAWKATTDYIQNVIKDILDVDNYNFEKQIGAEGFADAFVESYKKMYDEIKSLNKNVKDIDDKALKHDESLTELNIPTASPEDIEKWKEYFKYVLYTPDKLTGEVIIDDDHIAQVVYPILNTGKNAVKINKTSAFRERANDIIVFVLNNSEVAVELANAAKYLHKIAKLTNSPALSNRLKDITEFFDNKILDAALNNEAYMKDKSFTIARNGCNSIGFSIVTPAMEILKNISRL